MSWLDLADVHWNGGDLWEQHRAYVQTEIASQQQLAKWQAGGRSRRLADFFGPEAAEVFDEQLRAAVEEHTPGTGARVSHVAVPFGIRASRGQREEKGQRTRALVFLALGAAAAVQARADTLWVYENGIGALNLPLNESQLGVDNYRGVHPRSLRMFEDLVEQALDQPVHIRNPFLFRTKAEMCRGLPAAGLVDTVRDTVSCDSFPLRVKDTPQCGSCTSCVLRRQGLSASGLTRYDSSEAYRDDLSDPSTLSQDRLFGLEVMRGQVYRLDQCLSAADPWLALTTEYPKLARTQAEVAEHEGLEPGWVRDQFVRLYQSYVCEWRLFSQQLAGC